MPCFRDCFRQRPTLFETAIILVEELCVSIFRDGTFSCRVPYSMYLALLTDTCTCSNCLRSLPFICKVDGGRIQGADLWRAYANEAITRKSEQLEFLIPNSLKLFLHIYLQKSVVKVTCELRMATSQCQVDYVDFACTCCRQGR